MDSPLMPPVDTLRTAGWEHLKLIVHHKLLPILWLQVTLRAACWRRMVGGVTTEEWWRGGWCRKVAVPVPDGASWDAFCGQVSLPAALSVQLHVLACSGNVQHIEDCMISALQGMLPAQCATLPPSLSSSGGPSACRTDCNPAETLEAPVCRWQRSLNYGGWVAYIWLR